MFLFLVLSGFGCGFIYPSAIKAVMLWFPAQERATAIGVNQAAVNVSGMLGAVVVLAPRAERRGWQAGFLVAAAMAFAVCAFAALAYRDPRPRPGVPLSSAGAAAVSEVERGLPLVTGDGPPTGRREARLLRGAALPGRPAAGPGRQCLCVVAFSAVVTCGVPDGRWAYTGGGGAARCSPCTSVPAPSACRSAASSATARSAAAAGTR